MASRWFLVAYRAGKVECGIPLPKLEIIAI